MWTAGRADYETVCKWWVAHQWPPLPKELLPETSVMVSKDGKAICAGFLYLTNSNYGFLTWVISDPSSDRETRGEALDIMIDGVKAEAKLNGKTLIATFASHDNLIKRLQNSGFILGDEKVSNLMGKP